jgi:hypothetical protein
VDEPLPHDVSAQTDHHALLQRVANSQTFHRSARLRDLLLDIGEHTLAGRGGELSEQVIGVRVFGREQGYHASDDNIVRASVRQVRLKLKEYFDTEARHEPILLEIPKGSYVALFTTRATPAPAEAPRIPAFLPSWRRSWPVIAVGVALFAAAVWLVWGRSVNRPLEPQTVFTTLLAQNTDPVRVVLADSPLVIMEEITHDRPTLEEYSSRKYLQKGAALDPALSRLWSFLATRQITPLADVLILSRLYQENSAAARRIEIRYARHMQARDFKSGNFIITGSPRSDPWAALFDSSLNFQFALTSIGNTAPLASEPASFDLRPDGPDFARIALVRNLSGNGFVLLVAGLQPEGTEGAGEFLLRGDSLQQMRKVLGLGPRDPIPQCEFVLEIKTLQNTARSATIVASRRH